MTSMLCHITNVCYAIKFASENIIYKNIMKRSIRMKLQVCIEQLDFGNLMHFPKLKAMPNFVGVLRNLQKQLKTRYESIEKLKIWFSVFDTPLTVDFKDIQDAALQMELIKFKCDHRLREKFMNTTKIHEDPDERDFPANSSNVPVLVKSSHGTVSLETDYREKELFKCRAYLVNLIKIIANEPLNALFNCVNVLSLQGPHQTHYC
ncbi:hypothetical protein C0J52_03814 [Blattella germanica]|nr:hypothetical protein C0J52_03814 [Blattella germanica]